MPVTLAQAQVNSATDVDYSVIDNLRRSSWLMDQMVFDDTVTPGTGGASLVYGYTRLTAAAPAGFREINTEYTPGQATRAQYSVTLKPLGGAINIDRVLANLGPAATNEVNFQMAQLLESIKIRFCQEIILGDTATDAKGFDGLSKALTGTTTEKTAGYVAGSADWRASVVDTQAEANQRLDEIDDWLTNIVPSRTGSGDMGRTGALPPGVKAIIGNTKGISRFRAMARWASSYTSEKDSLGRQIDSYGDWALVDIGDRYDGSSPIIPTTGTGTGTTDLYAVTFGIDSLHAASPAGQQLVQTWLPDFNSAGAVKTGEVEMGPVASVLKNTKSAAVLRSVRVAD